MYLTSKIPEQRVQLEASEVGCCRKHWACSIRCWVGRTGQGDGMRGYSKEADEDGAQNKHDHQEDEKGGLGVDVGPHQADQETQQSDDRGIK